MPDGQSQYPALLDDLQGVFAGTLGLLVIQEVPAAWFETGWFYAAVDTLVLIALTRALIIQRRVHVVYAVGLPLMAVGQFVAWSLWQHPPAFWITLCREL